MKKIKEQSFFFFLIFISVFSTYAEPSCSLSWTLKYRKDDLKISKVEKDGHKYSEIILADYYYQGELGEPLLPLHLVRFSVPANATDFHIQTNVLKQEEVTLPFPPFPAQIPDAEQEVHPFVHLKPNTPAIDFSIGEIKSVSTIGGFNKIVTVGISPLLLTEESSVLTLINELEIKLNWREDNSLISKLYVPFHSQSRENAYLVAKNTVVNPDRVVSNSEFGVSSKLKSYNKERTEYEHIPYMIITPKRFSKTMERLAALRRLRGFNTKIVCIEDILSDPQYSIGDFISNIKDDAGKLRGFLFYAHQRNGTDHVLLAGPFPEIPGRWTRSIPNKGLESDSYIPEVFNYISDQYFRDLSYAWPKPTEIGYGDIDNMRYMSDDLSVGRLIFSRSEELDNYIDKVIQYEFNVRKIDQSYLDQAYVTFCHDDRISNRFNKHTLELYKNHFPTLILDSIALKENYSGKDAINNLNGNLSGFIDWRAHGTNNSIVLSKVSSYTYTGINALDAVKGSLEEEENNGLDNLSNEIYPAWTLSMSCSLNEIGKGFDSYNVAESFILGKKYGGVAFIGNTDAGFIWDSSYLCKLIFKAGCDLYSTGTSIPYAGSILIHGLSNYPYKGAINRHVRTVIGLTGDPLLQLWFKKPIECNKNGIFCPTLFSGQDSIWIANNYFINGIQDKKECRVSNVPSQQMILNATKILYRTDMVPYLYPTLISGLTVNQDKYLIAGNVIFENTTSSSHALVVSDNSNLTMEVLGQAEIKGDIGIEKGSKLTLKSYLPIKINNSKIIDGGEIELKSTKEVIIQKNSSFAKGVKLTIAKPE